jgi:radical SAM superfamily enzyme YgiQ (UPF0313 family)
MNILLISPPTKDMILANYPTSIEGDTGLFPPVGLLYIASTVEKKTPHRADVLDLNLVDNDPYDFLENLNGYSPDVIGITLITFNIISGIKTIKAARKRFPGVPIVAGGPHAHIYPEETIFYEGIDYVITGEGEYAFLELLKAIQGEISPMEVPALYFKQDNKAMKTRPHEFISNLDDLPYPDRTKTNFRRYSNITAKNRTSTFLITSRGCPHRCIYCHRPQMGKRFRAMSAEKVVGEIEECKALGLNWIDFFDDTFTLNKKRAEKICRLLIDKKIDILWSARTRVDRVDQKLLNLMSAAGCRKISFGIESGCQRILDRLQKDITLEQVQKTIKAARKAGISVYADFMIGNPDETIEDIKKTIGFACKLPIQYAQFSITTPYPSTPLYDEFRKKRPELGDYWQKFARDPHINFKTPIWSDGDIPAEDIIKLWHSAIKKFYFRPSKIFSEIGNQLVSFNPRRIRLALKMLFGK